MMNIPLRRISVRSRRSFDDAVRAFTATIGRPDPAEFQRAITAAVTLADLETIVGEAVGPSQLMEFARFDSGSILRKADGRPVPRILRLLVGNPLIMKEMVRTVPDAAAYAPVTILIDERADEVRLSYDSMASLLEPYRDEPALAVARDLDAKIENLMESAK